MNSADRLAIDAQRWPRIARIPEGKLLGRRAQLSEKSFERLCERYGIALGGESGVRMHIADSTFYARVAEGDWLGLGEAFLAGEWSSEELPNLLSLLLDSGLEVGPEGSFARGLRRLTRPRSLSDGSDDGGELPTSLLQLFAGDLIFGGSGLFASGVRTTSREEIPNNGKGAGRSGIPAKWAVDVTYVDAPRNVVRADLPAAQLRCIDHLLDMARVRAGDRVAEWPSAGGEIALRAAERGAGADVITVSDDHTESVMQRASEAGLSGAVRVEQVGRSIPSPREFTSDYEAVINVERLETFGEAGMVRWLRSAERILVERGTIVAQLAIATEKFDEAAHRSVELIRAYVWPQLNFVTMEQFRRIVDRETGLRVAAEEYIPAHYATTLRLQRSVFAGNARVAAGIGYDRVFRRLWDYSLALLEALVESGRLTMVQVELIHAPRRGR